MHIVVLAVTIRYGILSEIPRIPATATKVILGRVARVACPPMISLNDDLLHCWWTSHQCHPPVVSPNQNQDSWTHCGDIDSGSLKVFSEADSFHSGGVNTLMTDGSVRFIKDSINQQTWFALGTKANGKVIDASSY
jgi:prepilin-type processing-associated H-X9-DG protein